MTTIVSISALNQVPNSLNVTTPSTNRGLNSQNQDNTSESDIQEQTDISIKIDGIRLSLRFATVAELKFLVSKLYEVFNDSIDWTIDRPTVNGKLYQHSVHTVHGGVICWTNQQDSEPIECLVALGGKVIDSGTFTGLMQALAVLEPYIFSCTRLDIAIDDTTGTLRAIAPMLEAIAIEGKISGFRYTNFMNSGRAGDSQRLRTSYFGKRTSTKMVRIYDKGDGRYRYELEGHGKFSKQLLSDMLALYKTGANEVQILSHLRDIALGAINFYSHKEKNLSRSIVFTGWQVFIDLCKATPIKLTLPKVEKCLGKTIDHFKRTLPRTLAKLTEIFSPDWVNDFISDITIAGYQALTNFDRLQIETYRNKAQPCT
jgi:hypothetical protein